MVEWCFETCDAQAARRTRLEFVKRVHSTFGDEVDAMAAELVLGELIGNVVRYAPGVAHVRAEFDERGVTIAVKDRGTGFAAPAFDREMGLLSESGRGLAIVARLAETMEIDCQERTGCCVRARLAVRNHGLRRLLQILVHDLGRPFVSASGILTEFFARPALAHQIPQPVELNVHVVESAPVVRRHLAPLIEKRMLFGDERFDMLM